MPEVRKDEIDARLTTGEKHQRVKMFLLKPFLLFGSSPLNRVRERLPTLEVNFDDVVVERHPDSTGTSEQLLDEGKWRVIKATVIGSHVIPDIVAMHVPVSIQNARVGSDICEEGSSQHKKWQRQAVEIPLSTVLERHKINGFC